MNSCVQLILSWGGEGPGLEIRGHAVDRPAGERLHERRLAGAVRAYQYHLRIGRDDAVEAINVQRRAGVVAEVQVLYRNHVFVLVCSRQR